MYDISYIICCLCKESLNLREKIVKSSLSHIVLIKNNFMFQNVLLLIHLKMFKIVEHYLLQQTMLFCVTQNNNNSLGDTHVDHIL